MNKLARTELDGAQILTPSLGLLTSRLSKAMHQATLNMDTTSWNLIQDVLQYASDVEKTISNQRDHIEKLQSISTTDDLTGLPNRRGLNAYLTSAISSARRHGEYGLVAFLDLDGFKPVNDTHGHEAGDFVLQEVALILSEHIRTSDYAARLGGDEFVVVLDRTDLAKGKERLQHLQNNLDGAFIMYQGRKINIRASMGIAHYDGQTDANDLLVLADKAMYSEKASRSAAQTSN